jgi:hypothetical protein
MGEGEIFLKKLAHWTPEPGRGVHAASMCKVLAAWEVEAA